MTRWGMIILLTIIAFPFMRVVEVQGASDTKTVDGVTFGISADSEIDEGELLTVNLSVTGAWWAFYGNLTYDEIKIIVASPGAPIYDGGVYETGWNKTYKISNLEPGCHVFTFEARYSNVSWWLGWRGPVTVSVQACVITLEPTLTLAWLTPLSNRDSFEAGSKIPIRFSVDDDTGNFIRDESVTVTITNENGQQVFSATYGTGRDEVRIRESAEYYIVSWKTPRTPGPYTISVRFQGILVESLPIELQ